MNFQLQTLKDVNVRSHVQSRKLVHASGVCGHVRASSTSGRAFAHSIVISRVLRSKRKSSGDVAGTAGKSDWL